MTEYKVVIDVHNNYSIRSANEEEISLTWDEAVEELKQLSKKRTHIFEENIKEIK